MIGKISTGKGFGGTIEYVMGAGEWGKEDRAQVIWHTMSDDNPQHWAIEMEEHARALNPDLVESGKSDLVIHVSLSAAKGEHLTDLGWISVANEYLREMGWDKHDYILVRHDDRPHDHVHLVINRVGQDGQTADLHDDYPRQAQALEAIERRFGLDLSHAKMRAEAEQNPSKAIESLTQSHLTFTAKDVERYFHRMGFSDAEVQELTFRALTASNVLGTNDGRLTTSEVKQEVATLDGRFASLAARAHGPLTERATDVDPERQLTPDQQRTREGMLSGRGLVVGEGFAGSGKSMLLNQVRADLEANGYQVLGAAPTGKAADGLQASSGIQSSTIASLLGQLERAENPLQLSERTVLIIDEAAMARLDDLSRLSAHVQRAGGLLSMVGDSRQLAAVGHGGGLELAKQHAGSTVLDTIWRQSEGWQREATRAFGEGRAADAIQAYADHGAIHWSASIGSARENLIVDYIRAIDSGRSAGNMLAMAYRNEDVEKLNHGIRDELKARDMLGGEHTYRLTQRDGKMKDIELAQGDRVVLERNQKRLGISEEDVKNGMFGTVIRTSARDFTVLLDKGSVVNIDPSRYGHVSHGYASTVHKAQGATIERTFELASRGMGSNLTYVAMSRHKDETTLYANTADFKDTTDLVSKLSKSESLENFAKIMAAEGWLKQQGLDDRLGALLAQRYEQAAEAIAARPEIAEKVHELGIAPDQSKSYLEDVLGVLEKYADAGPSPVLPSFATEGPPGLDAFRDAFREWTTSLDDWKHDPLVPMNRTEQVIYAVLDGAVSAVWNGIVEGTKQGLDSESPGLLADLARVTADHATRAIEHGLDEMGDMAKSWATAVGKDQERARESGDSAEKPSDSGQSQCTDVRKGAEKGKDAGKKDDGPDKAPTKSHEQSGKDSQQWQERGQPDTSAGKDQPREQNRAPAQRESKGQDHGAPSKRSEPTKPAHNGSTQGKAAAPTPALVKNTDAGKSPAKSSEQRKDTASAKDTSNPARDGNKQATTAPRQNQAPSKGKPQNKTQATQQRATQGKSADKSKDSGKAQGQTKAPSKSLAPSKSPAKRADKGKTAANDKAAPQNKDSGQDRGYGRERYR